MRTALLAAERTTPQGALCAGLMLAGRQVLTWQAALACAAGCERIVVLSDAADETLAEAERECRSHGAAFHRLRQFAGLAALIHAEDELLLMGDAILPGREALLGLIAPGGPDKPLSKMVLCLPDDDPLAAGSPADFERIDAARCWAGVAVMRAAPVQRLGEFAPDSNAISLLLRMALQAGTPCHLIAAETHSGAQWLAAHSPEALSAHEQALIGRHRQPARWSAPGSALADRLARQIAFSRHASAPGVAGLAGLGAMLVSLVLGVAGWPVAALACALLASGAIDLAARIAQLRQAVLGEGPPAMLRHLADPGRDGLAMLTLAAAIAEVPLAALGPLATGTARLAAAQAPPLAAAFWRDRTAQLAMLTLGAGLGWLAEAAALLALAALAQALFAKPLRSIPL